MVYLFLVLGHRFLGPILSAPIIGDHLQVTGNLQVSQEITGNLSSSVVLIGNLTASFISGSKFASNYVTGTIFSIRNDNSPTTVSSSLTRKNLYFWFRWFIIFYF